MALTALEFVNALRVEEMRALLERHFALFANRDLLELGSGAGAQLLKLREICRSAEGLDTERRPDALTSVLTYDGKTFPFRDASFDVIFSSNVLEHIADEAAVYSEMHRVLRPGGICVHVVPTAAWRFWSSVFHYPSLAKKLAGRIFPTNDAQRNGAEAVNGHASTPRRRLLNALILRRHGEYGNWFTEHFRFRVAAWRQRFESHGWHVLLAEPVGCAQTGQYLLNERLTFENRQRLTKLMGAFEYLFVLTESARSSRT